MLLKNGCYFSVSGIWKMIKAMVSSRNKHFFFLKRWSFSLWKLGSFTILYFDNFCDRVNFYKPYKLLNTHGLNQNNIIFLTLILQLLPFLVLWNKCLFKDTFNLPNVHPPDILYFKQGKGIFWFSTLFSIRYNQNGIYIGRGRWIERYIRR